MGARDELLGKPSGNVEALDLDVDLIRKMIADEFAWESECRQAYRVTGARYSETG